MTAYRPSTPDRIAGRLLTGTVGHTVAGVLDWLEFTGKLAAGRFRRRAGDR